MTTTITSHDNRGTKDHPVGFVYFRRGRAEGRIGFGANRENPHPLAIWDTVYTGRLDDGDRDAIRGYLAGEFPHLINTKGQ